MNVIEQAFHSIHRADFLPLDMQGKAGTDMPLPIGHDQTNSQPSTVRAMLEWLDPRPGQKVLDLGSGSGWTSALLAHIVGPEGRVYAVERVPELVEFARENCGRAGIQNVTFFEAGEIFGLPEHAPFDRILVSASAEKLPEPLLDQLKPDGVLVVPVQNDILEITKHASGGIETIPHGGFVFVPLVGS